MIFFKIWHGDRERSGIHCRHFGILIKDLVFLDIRRQSWVKLGWDFMSYNEEVPNTVTYKVEAKPSLISLINDDAKQSYLFKVLEHAEIIKLITS